MKIYTVFFIVFFLSSCCSKSIVVLIPDDEGAVGEVEIQGENGTVLIDKAWNFTEVGPSGTVQQAQSMPKEKAEQIFGQALTAQPVAALDYMIYFDSGANVRQDCLQQLPGMVKKILSRTHYEITLIGHCDRVGDDVSNLRLSKKRTKAVRQLLVKHGVSVERIVSEEHYGENVPLVPTADGVAEPRNRRVEIFVR